MYHTATAQGDNIVENNQIYPLRGKADVVFQNTGSASVRIGNRLVKSGESYKLCGEHTVLQNESISIMFLEGESKAVWVHYVTPFVEGSCE